MRVRVGSRVPAFRRRRVVSLYDGKHVRCSICWRIIDVEQYEWHEREHARRTKGRTDPPAAVDRAACSAESTDRRKRGHDPQDRRREVGGAVPTRVGGLPTARFT
jgi:hypothetical protein